MRRLRVAASATCRRFSSRSTRTSTGSSHYASLIYVPANSASNQWTQIDASGDTGDHWAFTRDLDPTGTNCFTSGQYCTFTEAMALLNDGGPTATVLSVEISKGKDYAFSGAVDKLRMNNNQYDFEPFGVKTTTIS